MITITRYNLEAFINFLQRETNIDNLYLIRYSDFV